MNKLGLILYAVAFCLLTACGASSSEKCEAALDAGNLKEAEQYLKEIEDRDACRYYGGLLIDEYLAIGNLDRAIFVFDNITGHCSMYDMQWHNANATYTRVYAKKIYNTLLKENRYDEAWNYHGRSYDSEDYPGNAPDYFAYMVDVITHLCTNNRKAEAHRFVTTHIHWFTKNVDNHEWGKDYPQYYKSIMHGQLLDVLNSF